MCPLEEQPLPGVPAKRMVSLPAVYSGPSDLTTVTSTLSLLNIWQGPAACCLQVLTLDLWDFLVLVLCLILLLWH